MTAAIIIYLLAGLCIWWIASENSPFAWWEVVLTFLFWPFITAWKAVLVFRDELELGRYAKATKRPPYGEE